jgi:transcriptional regulator with XRE-family HTH domain
MSGFRRKPSRWPQKLIGPTFSQIERGVGNPSIAILVKLANKLAIDVSELVPRK